MTQQIVLLDSLRCSLVVLDGLKYSVLRVLYWIQVWQAWGPVYVISSLILQALHACMLLPYDTRTCHAPGAPRTQCSSIGSDNGSKDLNPISIQVPLPSSDHWYLQRLLGRRSHQCPVGGHFVLHWQYLSYSSLRKGADTRPGDGLKILYNFTFLRLCWETQ